MSLLVLLSLFFFSVPPSIPATRHTHTTRSHATAPACFTLVGLFFVVCFALFFFFLVNHFRRGLIVFGRAASSAIINRCTRTHKSRWRIAKGLSVHYDGGPSNCVFFFFSFLFWLDETAPVSSCQPNRESSISLLFFVFLFTTLLLLLLPVLCLLCAVSRSHHTRSGHRNKCWRRCGGVDRTKKKKGKRRRKRRKRGNDLITNRRRRRRLDCLHTSLTVCTLYLSVCYIDDPTTRGYSYTPLQKSSSSSSSFRVDSKIHSSPARALVVE